MTKLDSAMNRGSAMVMTLKQQDPMMSRAQKLVDENPKDCWISDVGTAIGIDRKPLVIPGYQYFYYFLKDGKYWVDETWVRTGVVSNEGS